MDHGIGRMVLIAVVLFLSGQPVLAQSKKTANTLKLDSLENMPKASITDLHWLTGHWSGEGLGGQCEEIWAPPTGDNMIGMFRFLKDGKTQFTELFSLVVEGESLVLKLKHFNADMTGWEEKDEFVTFRLVKLSKNEVNFDGLTYRKNADGTLESFVVLTKKDGSVSELSFKFKPAKAPIRPQG